MYLSLRWIEKFVTLPTMTAEELALKVTMSTVEVEEVTKQAKNLDGIVVGQIKELVKHPQADRLSICKTTVGSETLQIICGGSNLREGMLVAVAKVGSRVRWHGEGDLVTLESAKIRGQESHGMIVAASEVGLEKLFPATSEHEIIDLSDYNFKPGASLAESLDLTDVILAIDNKSMTHRPDLWGQYGLARELAAIFAVKCKPLRIPAIISDTNEVALSATVDPTVCQRFTAVVLDNIVVSPSPWWLRKALESVGMNSINNIVDITNYVMMELGHPMHAFDRSAVDGQLAVRLLTKTETLITLDQVKRKLEVGTPVIADNKKALDIAGIMGGEVSSIKTNTTSIILTCATFPASLIRRTSVKQNIRSDASARYEKSLDPSLAPQALALAVQLIKRLQPETRVVSKVLDIDHSPDYHRTIIVPKDLFAHLMGTAISDKEVKDILQRLQFGVRQQAKVWEVTVPSWRATKDITIPQDLVEEVARIFGYDNIIPELPRVALELPDRNPEQLLERQLKDILVTNAHYTETQNYSFASTIWAERLGLNTGQLPLRNYLTEDQKYLRTSLTPGLLDKLESNSRWSQEVSLFELGRVFISGKGDFATDATNKHWLPQQPKYLSGVVLSKAKSEEQVYLETKGLLLDLLAHYTIDGELVVAASEPWADKVYEFKSHDQTIVRFGLLAPELRVDYFNSATVVWWEINFAKLIKQAAWKRVFSAFPKYPNVTRDIAVIVDTSCIWSDLYREVKGTSGLIEKVELFDIFQSEKQLGVGKKSLAFSLTFRSPEKTLTSEDIETVMQKIVKNLKTKFRAEQR